MTKSKYQKNKVPLGRKFVADALLNLADRLYNSQLDEHSGKYDKEVSEYILANCTLLVALAKREIK